MLKVKERRGETEQYRSRGIAERRRQTNEVCEITRATDRDEPCGVRIESAANARPESIEAINDKN
jgi:hypothetical protein